MISVIIPVYNEEACLKDTHNRLVAALEPLQMEWEFIYVDDGSWDASWEIIKELAAADNRVRAVSFSRNFGHQTAVSAGVDFAHGDAAVVIDADLQDPPEVIPEFIKKWREGYEVVYGVRQKRKESFLKKTAYAAFYRFLKRIAYIEIPLDSGDFALMDKKVLDQLRVMPERHRFVRGLRSWIGFRQIGIPYERAARFAGEPKYTVQKLIKLAYDGIISFSFFPLRVVTISGFIVSGSAFFSIFVVLYFRLFTDKSIPGFASLAIIVLFLGGVQLLGIGFVGEYITRIFDEVKQRPRYIVRELVNPR
ncbi:MAG: Glycosyltransferase [Candidatus Magasanikbacteria bacterium]|nr:Glycosyltransferase [Candidatus Magasanikbacteria bacterium]